MSSTIGQKAGQTITDLIFLRFRSEPRAGGFRAGLLALWVLAGAASAESTLSIALRPSIRIDGVLGSMQEVQYTTNLNDPLSWQFLGYQRLAPGTNYFTDVNASGAQRYYRAQTIALTDTNLVWIPPGSFLMGSPTNEAMRNANEGPQTTVVFPTGFFIGRYEVINAEYLKVMGSLPDTTDTGVSNYLALPIRVDFSEAELYCSNRTEMDLGTGSIPSGYAYRMPTEAEWEYACRAGTTTAFNVGPALYDDAILGSLATFNGKSPYPTNTPSPSPLTHGGPTAVGMHPANAFGLYDMHGNVEELCWDGTLDPQIPPLPGGTITNGPRAYPPINPYVRGGNFDATGVRCRSASRAIGLRASDYGFRVVLAPASGN